jgi:hypothetical protein
LARFSGLRTWFPDPTSLAINWYTSYMLSPDAQLCGEAQRARFQFDEADADFLTDFAGLLGVTIERQQADAKLQEALKYQALLTRK